MAFLSSWGHWEQQGRPREQLVPEVGLEEALGPSRCAHLAPQRPGAEALQVQAQLWETN